VEPSIDAPTAHPGLSVWLKRAKIFCTWLAASAGGAIVWAKAAGAAARTNRSFLTERIIVITI